ncbi:hypothetical protein [Vibrio sp. S234-5]|uniref:hypothetical protein n=1 Tax=Vibrio sp. S234-5 TaxID=1616781 RepID=UPI00061E18FB|nr:hypothetical protein [Vibrio sp. S234-5]KJR29099.1 hypothetical protein UF06_12515 [Vibrio sp. S234-5]
MTMKEKVTLKPITPNTIYFPSLDEFALFLGFGVSARSKARILKEQLSLDLKVSERSLDNLGSKGISEKKARLASWPILRFLFQKGLFLFFKELPKDVRATDVIHTWLIMLRSFNHEQPYINLQPLHSFLNHRDQLYQPIKHFIDTMPKLTTDNQTELLVSFYQLALPKTLLSQEEQKEILRLVASDDMNREENGTNRLCIQYWFYDFHLSLMAALDVTILDNFNLVSEYEYGIFSHVFKKDGATYLSKLLNHLIEKMDFRYCQLAKFIPIKRERESECETSMFEAQTKTLKEWRSGKTHPTNKTLIKFFENIDTESYALPILLVAMICIGLDKRLKDPKIKPWTEEFQSTFSAERYAIYFEHFKNKLPELAA